MSYGQKILLSLVALVLLNILLVIIFGDRGLVEVNQLKDERDHLMRDNHDLKEKNTALRREIERLKSDPAYIEHVARQELGMIGRDEVIVRFNAPEGENTIAEITEAGGDAIFVQGDVANEADIEEAVAKTVETYGRLDGAFNNAGIGALGGPLAELENDVYEDVFRVNVRGVWHGDAKESSKSFL